MGIRVSNSMKCTPRRSAVSIRDRPSSDPGTGQTVFRLLRLFAVEEVHLRQWVKAVIPGLRAGSECIHQLVDIFGRHPCRRAGREFLDSLPVQDGHGGGRGLHVILSADVQHLPGHAEVTQGITPGGVHLVSISLVDQGQDQRAVQVHRRELEIPLLAACGRLHRVFDPFLLDVRYPDVQQDTVTPRTRGPLLFEQPIR